MAATLQRHPTTLRCHGLFIAPAVLPSQAPTSTQIIPTTASASHTLLATDGPLPKWHKIPHSTHSTPLRAGGRHPQHRRWSNRLRPRGHRQLFSTPFLPRPWHAASQPHYLTGVLTHYMARAAQTWRRWKYFPLKKFFASTITVSAVVTTAPHLMNRARDFTKNTQLARGRRRHIPVSLWEPPRAVMAIQTTHRLSSHRPATARALPVVTLK